MTNRTEELIIEMLKEDTGSHILDSGYSYGRHWERNQNRDFKNESEFTIHIFEDKPEYVTKILYHHMNEYLDFCDELQDLCKNWNANEDREATSHLDDLDSFVNHHMKIGLFEESYLGIGTFNTYNDGDHCLILSVHGGYDVRGGYSTPKLFYANDLDGGFWSWDRAYGLGSEIDCSAFDGGFVSCEDGVSLIENPKLTDFYPDYLDVNQRR